ncbi:MAG: Uma2 family endonuclease [Paludisphaera borealis]|uniref:Uma2 family endonuclease n=1 Tax=Paludisphaera borealis TaxID=1387353 RepID=UPI0028432A89|nr:Uma2 family endonuclease [Paludisphaera borealis]MDR3619537.1 Uma2 family endonuclease [Paludisphaera borealis]
MATVESKKKLREPATARPIALYEDDDRIGPGSAGLRMKPEEFDAIPASEFVRGYRYEIINGVLVVTPPVGNAEADPNDDLGHLLRTYLESHEAAKPFDRTMPERHVPGTPNRRRCDRAVWVGLGRLPDTERDVPAIVIEFVSSGRRDAFRDYEEKREEYLAAGVKEYWIIDRFRRVMTVYKTKKTRKSSTTTYDIVTEGQSYETPLLPGFSLPLARLLEKADQWRPRKQAEPNAPAGGTDG